MCQPATAQTATVAGNWTQQSPTSSPGASAYTAMSDEAGLRSLLYFDGNTWTWDGTNWVKQAPVSSPTPRSEYMLAYTTLFGGYSNGTVLNDTWTWNGTNWSQRTPASSPSPRIDASMVFDAATGNTVLFGGRRGCSHLFQQGGLSVNHGDEVLKVMAGEYSPAPRPRNASIFVARKVRCGDCPDGHTVR